MGFHATESTEGSGAVEGPELDGIVPRSGEERIAARRVLIETVDFTGVFFHGADRVGLRKESGVVDLDRSIGYGGGEDGIVGFGPGDVVDTFSGVEGNELVDDGAGRGEIDDVDTAVTYYAEVLRSGYG
ncbi:hypothetical protein F3Y22_tig00111794pilonHSYRG00047 [Hibiscus syriacus]|uniref:Uncharacterized protein n=1 Tax=Hibiscus syriacus TaxID=106335 RepID=A0A6A2XDB5_HIBSY|nr:hypothetical protein F3Y22_tig00111794pilonHSYRG00047 [Hibiscus syriacus]